MARYGAGETRVEAAPRSSCDHERVSVRCIAGVCAGLLAGALAGCGLNVASPDLFVLTRTGQGGKLTLLVNDGGTVRCNGGKVSPCPTRSCWPPAT